MNQLPENSLRTYDVTLGTFCKKCKFSFLVTYMINGRCIHISRVGLLRTLNLILPLEQVGSFIGKLKLLNIKIQEVALWCLSYNYNKLSLVESLNS